MSNWPSYCTLIKTAISVKNIPRLNFHIFGVLPVSFLQWPRSTSVPLRSMRVPRTSRPWPARRAGAARSWTPPIMSKIKYHLLPLIFLNLNIHTIWYWNWKKLKLVSALTYTLLNWKWKWYILPSARWLIPPWPYSISFAAFSVPFFSIQPVRFSIHPVPRLFPWPRPLIPIPRPGTWFWAIARQRSMSGPSPWWFFFFFLRLIEMLTNQSNCKIGNLSYSVFWISASFHVFFYHFLFFRNWWRFLRCTAVHFIIQVWQFTRLHYDFGFSTLLKCMSFALSEYGTRLFYRVTKPIVYTFFKTH